MHELVVWDLSRIGVLWHPKKTVAGKCRTFACFKLLHTVAGRMYEDLGRIAFKYSKTLSFRN